MGFTKQIIRAGNGVKPSRGQAVTVHCTGFGKDRDLAKKFWSTKDPGQEPFTFNVGRGEGQSIGGCVVIRGEASKLEARATLVEIQLALLLVLSCFRLCNCELTQVDLLSIRSHQGVGRICH